MTTDTAHPASSIPAFVLRWPDSELAGAHVDSPTTLRLRLAAAACHRVADGVAGYLQPVELVFHGASWSGDAPAVCLGGIVQGRLSVDGVVPGGIAQGLPLPLEVQGAVVCEFRLMSGTALRIAAQGLRVSAGENARFHESYAC
jgi:hypothetical protein